MTGPEIFGSRAAGALLYVPGVLYRGAVAARNALYDAGRLRAHRLPCTVVSIGNLTVGGTGKTPLTSHVAGLLRDAGYAVGVVSRGYRRSGSGPLLVSDGRALKADAAAAGDEPYLIARDNPSVPVAVGADRRVAARLLLAARPLEVLVLDDAFQHRRVARDLDLLLVDGRDPWGNGKMLPRGPLREPPASLKRADAIVVTRSSGSLPAALASAIERFNPRVRLFRCRMEPRGFSGAGGDRVGPAALKGFRAFAFSGIARPERFEEDLSGLGVTIAGARRFPDHHRYRGADLESIVREARALRAEVLVTTEKDRVRIVDTPEGSPPLYALVIEPFFAPGEGLEAFLLDRLAAARPARRPA